MFQLENLKKPSHIAVETFKPSHFTQKHNLVHETGFNLKHGYKSEHLWKRESAYVHSLRERAVKEMKRRYLQKIDTFVSRTLWCVTFDISGILEIHCSIVNTSDSNSQKVLLQKVQFSFGISIHSCSSLVVGLSLDTNQSHHC